MCRMIAAVGRFDIAPLVDGLRTMAANANAGYDHEFRDRGDAFQHDCGWGAVWRDGNSLARRRTAESCVVDPNLEELKVLATDLAVVHARRTPNRGTIAEKNSHPFVETRFGETWSFCHNGTVKGMSRLPSEAPLENPAPVDSELLFHHLLAGLDPDRPTESMSDILNAISDFTCLNCFLATPDAVHVYARVASNTTRRRYYMLWLGRGDGLALASSEPLPLDGIEWTPVPDGSAFTLSP